MAMLYDSNGKPRINRNRRNHMDIKPGDIVKFTDGSFTVEIKDGELCHGDYSAYGSNKNIRWRVLAIDCVLPIDRSIEGGISTAGGHAYHTSIGIFKNSALLTSGDRIMFVAPGHIKKVCSKCNTPSKVCEECGEPIKG